MDAKASTVSSSKHIASIAAAAAVGLGALLMTAGCGHHKSSEVQSPPPQTLSEPVRPMDPPPLAPPAIPASVDNQYADQKPGESRALPAFEAPPPAYVAPAPAAVVVSPSAADQRDAKGRYHTLQKGETLYAVARQYNVKPKQIIDANQFRDPNRLSVGTKVYIPD
jgi:LysM repeat protein